MSGAYSHRVFQVAPRGYQRDEQKRQRELERRLKEQAKLSEREQAKLEVEAFENQVAVLLSVQKEQGETWNWGALAAALPPPVPRKFSAHEVNARLQVAMLRAQQMQTSDGEIEKAQSQDEQDYQTALRLHHEQVAESEKLKGLARRIVAGEHKAYTEALVEFSPLAEISNLGSSIHFSVHSARLIECVVKVTGAQAIPNEVKALTASGKLSVKAMPKARFHELYQDYICGCMLRVAREVFALLPVECVLVTATTDMLDSRTGKVGETPVLSAAFPRTGFERLDFNSLDPSDSLENFLHRGDFKASRKTEAFQPIDPLTIADLPDIPSAERTSSSDLLARVKQMREELRLLSAELKPAEPEPETVTII